MAFSRGAWAFGTPTERSDLGGIPLRLLWDTVLPYTEPAVDPPGWWPTGGHNGQFQYPEDNPNWQTEQLWERNMAEVGGSAPNFPQDRSLNCVLIAMLALKQSSSAPWRMTERNGVPVPNLADNKWPFESEVGIGDAVLASDALIWYAENYLAPDTKVIVMIPERDVINAIADGTDQLPWNVLPSHSAGAAAIAAFVRLACLPVAQGGAGLLDRLLAWYAVDEPDIIGRQRWALAGRLTKLRKLIRDAEFAVRKELNPELSDDEIEALLLPVMITLSRASVLNLGDAQPPQYYKFGRYQDLTGAADIYGFDWYPYLRSEESIREDYEGMCTGDGPRPITAEIYTAVDPVESLLTLRRLRQQLNGSALPGDDDYLPVVLWNQPAGAPFHDGSISSSSATSPAKVDPPTSADCSSEPDYGRMKRWPGLDSLRFYGWGGILELAEGIAGFNQFSAPDDKLVTDLVPLMREFEFLQSWRHGSNDLSGDILRREVVYQPTLPVRKDLEPYATLPPAILYFQLTTPPNPSPVPFPNNAWLLIVNRDPRRLGLVLDFRLQPGGPNYAFQSYDFLQYGFTFRPVTAASQSLGFDVAPYGVQLYRRIAWPM